MKRAELEKILTDAYEASDDDLRAAIVKDLLTRASSRSLSEMIESYKEMGVLS